MSTPYQQFFAHNPHVFQEVDQTLANAENFWHELQPWLKKVRSVLSIGAGEGRLERHLITERNCQVGVIEPTAAYIDQLQAAGGFRELFAGTFQEYVPSYEYDLVIAIHSWYAMGCDSDMLKKAMSCGKRLFITIGANTNFMQKIALRFRKHVDNTSAESLSRWAWRQRLPHRFWLNQRRIPAEHVIQAGHPTRAGQALIQLPAFRAWEDFSAADKAEASQMLQAEICDGMLTLYNGCLLFERQPRRRLGPAHYSGLSYTESP